MDKEDINQGVIITMIGNGEERERVVWSEYGRQNGEDKTSYLQLL